MERYCYKGPIYYYGNNIGSRTLYTMAPSITKAKNNILFKLGDCNPIEAYRYDICDRNLFVCPERNADDSVIADISSRSRCEQCGYELNDMGECPVCDYGEYDLLEAMRQLSTIDE